MKKLFKFYFTNKDYLAGVINLGCNIILKINVKEVPGVYWKCSPSALGVEQIYLIYYHN